MHTVGRIWTLLLGALIAASLVGCGEDAEAEKTTVASVVVRAGASTVVADGLSATALRATVRTADGLPVIGVTVDFATTLGTLKPDTAKTDDNGVAEVNIVSGTTGSAEVSANVAGVGSSLKIDFVAPKVQAAPVAKLAIGASKSAIPSNHADESVITVTVLDSRNAVIPGILVDFSSTGGELTKGGAITDEKGAATIGLKSQIGDPTNQVITVTATVGSLSKFIPIQVTGSSLALQANSNALVIDSATTAEKTATVTVTAKDAANNPVYNVPVTLSVSGSGSATLAASSGTTDINGVMSTTLTGTAEGTIEITAQAIGAKGTMAFSIAKALQTFRITTPATEVSSATLNTIKTFTVSAPTQATVTFITSLGTLKPASATDCAVPGSATLDVAVANGEASVKFCPAIGGTATVEVIDKAVPSTKDSVTVFVAAPADTASKITLQSNVTILPISSGELSHHADLVATVTNAAGIPVINRPVWFGVENATGGGETVSPAYGLTDAKGQIKIKFTSGSLSSNPRNPQNSSSGGVVITATADTTIKSSVSIVIGGVAGTIVLGTSTSISSEANDTAYKLPVSVFVTDSNGSAVAGATVSLSAWPASYRKGHWFEIRDSSGNITDCESHHSAAWIANPDTNGNLTIDGTEVGPLQPSMAAAGGVPQTVQTDANGLGTFDLSYVKGSANWVQTQIVASTQVFGSQSSTTFLVPLPGSRPDIKACALADSPFGDDLGHAATH